MKSYLFEIPGEPFAKQRHRTNFKTHTEYNTPKNEQYENLVKTCFAQKYPTESPSDDWVLIQVLAIYPIPASWTKKKKILADKTCVFPRKHDWDNIGKIVCDGLNGVAWHDDKQIVDGGVYKRFGERPRAVVLIETYTTDELIEKNRILTAEEIERMMHICLE